MPPAELIRPRFRHSLTLGSDVLFHATRKAKRPEYRKRVYAASKAVVRIRQPFIVCRRLWTLYIFDSRDRCHLRSTETREVLYITSNFESFFCVGYEIRDGTRTFARLRQKEYFRTSLTIFKLANHPLFLRSRGRGQRHRMQPHESPRQIFAIDQPFYVFKRSSQVEIGMPSAVSIKAAMVSGCTEAEG